jgi:hypothetical protein
MDTFNLRIVTRTTRFLLTAIQVFGEMALLGLTADGKRARTTTSVLVCELCQFSKRDFIGMCHVTNSCAHARVF